MVEWKVALLNGALATFGALVIGGLAFWAAFRQGSKVLQAAERQAQAAERQALAAIEAAVETGRRQHELARWQARRDTYVKLLSAAETFKEKAVRHAGLIPGTDPGPSRREMMDAYKNLKMTVDLVVLEGPKEVIEGPATLLGSRAGSLSSAAGFAASRGSGGPSMGEEVLIRYGQCLHDLKTKMYEVLHGQDNHS